MEEIVEKILKQTYKNKKEFLETKQQELKRVQKAREGYLIEIAEEKQYVLFLNRMLDEQNDEVLRKQLQKTIKDVEKSLSYEDLQLQQYEEDSKRIQAFVDIYQEQVESFEKYLKQEGVMIDE